MSDIKPSFAEWDEQLVRGLRGIPIADLVCQCIVGSHLDARCLRTLHDIDICIIVGRLRREPLWDLYGRLAQLAEELSSGQLSVFVERRSGPLKPAPPPPGHHIAQLHSLVHDVNGWRRAVRYPGCNRWVRRNRHIRGMELASIVSVPRVCTSAIHRDLLVALENVRTATAYCRAYSFSAEDVFPVVLRPHLSRGQHFQVVLHAGICGFENTTDPCMGGQGLRSMSPLIRRSYFGLYKHLVGLRAKIGDGHEVSRSEAERTTNDVLQMLTTLVGLTGGRE